MNGARPMGRLKYAAPLAAILCLGACGSSAAGTTSGSDGASDNGCAAGLIYCPACHGGGVCLELDTCPAIGCPSDDSGSGSSSGGGGSSGAGGSSGGGEAGGPDAASDLDAAPADANAADASGCTGAMPDYCVDCNGGGFCVSGGCPFIRCPVHDAGLDASPIAEAGAGDAGQTACGNCGANQVCLHPGCGGALPPCTPVDAGASACPAGYTYSPNCWNGKGSGPGCSPPPCVPPAPHCADIPASCASQLTCACFNSANLCNGMACGIVSGRDVSCLAGWPGRARPSALPAAAIDDPTRRRGGATRPTARIIADTSGISAWKVRRYQTTGDA